MNESACRLSEQSIGVRGQSQTGGGMRVRAGRINNGELALIEVSFSSESRLAKPGVCARFPSRR